jgi:prophage endopeptidase
MLWKAIETHWRIIAAAMLVLMLIITAKIARSNYDRAIASEHELKLSQATIADMQSRQRDAAVLDEKYTKELADANAENAALQRKLDNGGRVLVKGRCPVPAKTGPASVDDVGTVELSDVAGRNVLGIRAGIKQDQAALRGLQEYIRQQCQN